MRVRVEATWTVKDDEEDDREEKGHFWLWHWGLDYTIIETENDRIPVSFTIAICEDCNTGQIVCFKPEQIKILGKEIKK